MNGPIVKKVKKNCIQSHITMHSSANLGIAK